MKKSARKKAHLYNVYLMRKGARKGPHPTPPRPRPYNEIRADPLILFIFQRNLRS